MTTIEQKKTLSQWFEELQKRICRVLEEIEQEFQHLDKPAGKFSFIPWKRQDYGQQDGGGGTMGIMKGRVFEKAGVNSSTTYGKFSPEFQKEIPGAEDNPVFWASGTSLVIHPFNPYVPIVHMNTRHIVTTCSWFGGGADLTPVFPFEEDTKEFHGVLEKVCSVFDSTYYSKYKTWCDDYFYIKHRNEPRGVGGIFYDYHNTNDFEKDLMFTIAVGEAFLDIYPKIVRRRMYQPFDEEARKQQLKKRSRYVEFNLIYDRGTRFGLMTHGNIEAILMSLPPLAAWD